MRITLVGLLLAIPVVLAAQATDSGRIYLPPPVERSYEPEVTVDRFTGNKAIWLELGRTPPGDSGIDIAATCSGVQYHGGDHVTIGLERIVLRDGQSALFLSVHTYGEHWLFYQEHSMRMLVDSTRLELEAFGDGRRDVDEGDVSESQSFVVTPRQLRMIANGASAEGKVIGTEGDCEFQLPSESKKGITSFLAREYPKRQR